MDKDKILVLRERARTFKYRAEQQPKRVWDNNTGDTVALFSDSLNTKNEAVANVQPFWGRSKEAMAAGENLYYIVEMLVAHDGKYNALDVLCELALKGLKNEQEECKRDHCDDDNSECHTSDDCECNCDSPCDGDPEHGSCNFEGDMTSVTAEEPCYCCRQADGCASICVCQVQKEVITKG